VQAAETEAKRHMEKDVFNIGKSVVFKGELSGHEDLFIEGTVEGKIELRDYVLTVGPNAKIKAEVFAKVVIVRGEVVGNITAGEKLDIRDSGSVDGDIAAPLVSIAEGAHLRGSVDMQKKPAAAATPTQTAKPEVKLAPLPAGAPSPGGQRVAGA
jgi:cytoskeletal protein CcmA (bactofilin family)